MKKLSLLIASALILSGCAEKKQYEQTVLAQMQQDKDLKDYKLDPETMTDCVVDLSSKNMPGAFAYDPKRLEAYRHYTKMLTLGKAEHPEKVLAELRTDFGSAKQLAEAHSNYTQSVLECIGVLIAKSEK